MSMCPTRSLFALLTAVAVVVVGLQALSVRAHDAEGDTLDFSKAPADVLPWGYLAKVGVRYEEDRGVPHFLPPVLGNV